MAGAAASMTPSPATTSVSFLSIGLYLFVNTVNTSAVLKPLLQLIKIVIIEGRVCKRGEINCPRIRASSLGKCLLLGTGARQPPVDRVVPLDAPGLLVDPVELIVLLRVLLDDGPRSCPRRLILDRDFVIDRLRTGTGPAFDQMQISLIGSSEVRLAAEIRDVDNQRVTFPVAARIPKPESDGRGEMRTSVHRDRAVPTLPLAGVIENRHASRCLRDLPDAR